MNRPARLFLPLCLVLLAATSRCACLTATSSTGTCEGQVGGVDISGEVDPESEHHTLYRAPNGASVDHTVLNLSCGKGKLKVRGTLHHISVFGESYSLPTNGGPCPPVQSDGGVEDAGTGDAGTGDAGTGTCGSSQNPEYPLALEWEVLTPDVTPLLVAGVVKAVLKLDESIDGTVTMEFADGTKVVIRYDVYHEDSLDVGEPPSSSGSGDSDSD
ncbi:hypothetical protein [Vitiosangium sp. GDMCC 1.1324]|uniref:hypothetical protein n=1 Tax=Vitiosangium sp. (strain GDMCC 1.1324) TaxID=2138576 RepID=UPI000D3C8BB5|nr:hypothetical protein [Vitiosangium sp. GDMCC 1.1324]PTL81174.1 hypothetical protein DAT35_23915 [Vitiosangium sp. GDMCC 1.1324]